MAFTLRRGGWSEVPIRKWGKRGPCRKRGSPKKKGLVDREVLVETRGGKGRAVYIGFLDKGSGVLGKGGKGLRRIRQER